MLIPFEIRNFLTTNYHSRQNISGQDAACIIADSNQLELHPDSGGVQSRVLGALEAETRGERKRTRLLSVPENSRDPAAAEDRLEGGPGSLVEIRDDPDKVQGQLHFDHLEECLVDRVAVRQANVPRQQFGFQAKGANEEGVFHRETPGHKLSRAKTEGTACAKRRRQSDGVSFARGKDEVHNGHAAGAFQLSYCGS